MSGNGSLTVRHDGGGTPVLEDWGINSEYGVLRDVLLGPAETFGVMDNAAFSSIARDSLQRGRPFDKQVAMRQHRELVEAYEDAGVTVHMTQPDEHTWYQVYTRDSSFMTPFGAVVTQLANPRRRGEYASALRFYHAKGIPLYELVSAGSFEGGDFNMIEPGAVLIGYTDHRSEGVAAKQIGGWMEAEGWEVKYAPTDPFYVHIDLMVCMLAEKLAAVCLDSTDPDIVDWLKARKVEIVPVSFQDTMKLGCNVMSLGDDRVIAPASSPALIEKLRALGFTVYDPDVSMFLERGGGVHCMAQPLRRDRV